MSGTPVTAGDSLTPEEALRLITGGLELRRLKKGQPGAVHTVKLTEDYRKLRYMSQGKCLPQLKPNGLKKVKVNDIVEVRLGFKTDNFHRVMAHPTLANEIKEGCCFSVILRHQQLLQKAVDFIAETPQEVQIWSTAFQHLISKRHSDRADFNESSWLKSKFDEADTHKDGILTFAELWALLQSLNIEVTEAYAQQIFDSVNIRKAVIKGQDGLDREEFTNFFRSLTSRPELKALMKLYSTVNGEILLPQDLQAFLINEQRMPNVSIAYCQMLIEKFEIGHNRDQHLLSENGFRKLLLSDEFSIVNKEVLNKPDDMTLPLHNYWINSSHNTYLTAGQLMGDATGEGYVNALLKGARLVELDVWDGYDNEPTITHGMTLVEPMTVKSAAKAIMARAFDISPYPVILSIENHASEPFQRRMVDHFKEIFGSHLYTKELTAVEMLGKFPSPNDLLRKILVKNKKAGADQIDSARSFTSVTTTTTKMERSGDGGLEVTKVITTVSDGLITAEGVDVEELEEEIDDIKQSLSQERNLSDMTDGKSPRKVRIYGVIPELSEITTVRSVHLKDLDKGLREHPCDSCASWVESKVVYNLANNYDKLLHYTSQHLLKSYPSGLRTESGNMEPMAQWLAGIQIVALNMQTPGVEMDLNEALFSLNANAGYVLKPAAIRNGTFNLTRANYSPDVLSLTVTVISGQYLPKPFEKSSDIVDPFVTVEIHGIEADKVKKQTDYVLNNGFTPVWNWKFSFRLKQPDLAFLRFCVEDSDYGGSQFIGQFCCPVKCLNDGYHHVKLKTGLARTTDATASLFVRIEQHRLDQDSSNEAIVKSLAY